MKLSTLKKRAQRATTFRGHRMHWSEQPGLNGMILFGQCVRCQQSVWCDAHPPPNGIDICGEAVALNCTGDASCES